MEPVVRPPMPGALLADGPVDDGFDDVAVAVDVELLLLGDIS